VKDGQQEGIMGMGRQLLTPLLNMFDILIAIVQRIASLMSIRVKGGGRWLLSGLQGLCPRTYIAVLAKQGQTRNVV
jgi:hypothetical protein